MIKSCQIYWKHVAVYGQSVDLWMLRLTDWEDKFDEELKLFGIASTFPAPYERGLARVGSLNITLSSGAHGPFPRILKEYAWVKMGEIALSEFSFHSLPEELMITMPQLQGLDLTDCIVSQLPSFFPWDSDNLNLPGNLTTIPAEINYISLYLGIHVVPYQYIRDLYLYKNNIITNLTDSQFSGYFQMLSLQ